MPDLQSIQGNGLFDVIRAPLRRISLNERSVALEIRPGHGGPLGHLYSPPVLVARRAFVLIKPDPGQASGASVEARFDVDSIRVLSDHIAEADRLKIETLVHDRLLAGSRHPVILFRMLELSIDAGKGSLFMKGTLTIRGKTRPIFLHFRKVDADTYVAKSVLRQTDFGIEPATALLGALRSQDEISISCTVTVPGAA